MPQASASDLGGCGLSKRPSDPAKTQEGEGGGAGNASGSKTEGGAPELPKMTGDARRGSNGDGVDLGGRGGVDGRGG